MGLTGNGFHRNHGQKFQAADLIDDANVPGYKKAHVQIDMDNFEANGEAYPFDQITPIQAVIPALQVQAASTVETYIWTTSKSGQ